MEHLKGSKARTIVVGGLALIATAFIGAPEAAARPRDHAPAWGYRYNRADFDGDGIPNHRDRDDDNDGICDSRDSNDRSYRRYRTNRYGSVPTGYRYYGTRRDRDGDGIRNRNDRDIDGDGIRNGRDRSPYNANRS